MNTKNKIVSIFGWLIFIPCIFVISMSLFFGVDRMRAFTNNPEATILVDDEKSPLLIFLIAPQDFPDEYKWARLRKAQSGGGASMILGGFYNGSEIDIFNYVTPTSSEDIWKITSDPTVSKIGT